MKKLLYVITLVAIWSSVGMSAGSNIKCTKSMPPRCTDEHGNVVHEVKTETGVPVRCTKSYPPTCYDEHGHVVKGPRTGAEPLVR